MPIAIEVEVDVEQARKVELLQAQLVLAIHDAITTTLKRTPDAETPDEFNFCIVNALLHAAGDAIAITGRDDPKVAAALALYVARHASEVIQRSAVKAWDSFEAKRETVN